MTAPSAFVLRASRRYAHSRGLAAAARLATAGFTVLGLARETIRRTAATGGGVRGGCGEKAPDRPEPGSFDKMITLRLAPRPPGATSGR